MNSTERKLLMEAFLVLTSSLLTPILVSWIKQNNWPDWAKVLLTLGLSVAAGALIALVDQRADTSDILGTGSLIFTLAVTFYKTCFQSTRLNQRLEGGPEASASKTARATFVRPAARLNERGR
jgi:hypothetical protein